MRIVGSRLGDHVKNAARRAAILRAKGVGLHLEFLHRVRVGVNDRLVLGWRRIGRSVQQEFIGRRPLSIDRNGHRADLIDGQVVDSDRLPHSRHQHPQRIRIASQQRQFDNLLGPHHLAHRGTLAIEQHCLRADVDRFSDCAHFQHQIEPGDLLYHELQFGLANRLESGLRHGKVVDARQQRWKIVVALVVGLDISGNTASLGDGGHAGLRDNCAGWVGDTAGNGCRLGKERGNGQ